jgi:hypothetical protein
MASRKQRRRRQKERRHEYEYVYVDDEGREVEVDPAEVESERPRPSRRDGKPANGKPSTRKSQGGRPVRKVDPPSWGRVIRRALILGPAIFFAITLLNHKQSLATHLAVTAFYTAFFIPFMYLLDRAMYRTYLKRTGQTPPAAAGRR